MRTTPLIQAAEELIGRHPAPKGDTVFVHADLHMANTLWEADSLVGIVDWDSAGAGHPGVDLGSLRVDVALHYDPALMDEVVRGWEGASGQETGHLAYWDVATALNTPAKMGGQTERREAFLHEALNRLDRG